MTFIASATNQNPIQKANMMLLSKEATNKDQSLKMQMMLSLDKDISTNSENKLEKNGFFGDQRGDFTSKTQIFQKIPLFVIMKVQFRL